MNLIEILHLILFSSAHTVDPGYIVNLYNYRNEYRNDLCYRANHGIKKLHIVQWTVMFTYTVKSLLVTSIWERSSVKKIQNPTILLTYSLRNYSGKKSAIFLSQTHTKISYCAHYVWQDIVLSLEQGPNPLFLVQTSKSYCLSPKDFHVTREIQYHMRAIIKQGD